MERPRFEGWGLHLPVLPSCDPQGGLRLVHLAETERLDRSLHPAIGAVIFKNPDPSVRALASGYFPRADGHSLPAVAELAALEGDARHGRELFFDPDSQCASCHAVRRGTSRRGQDVGPELSNVRSKYKKSELLDAILNPSAAIAFGYDTWMLVDDDGRVFSGFVLADGEDVVIKDTQGRRHVLAAEDIAERHKQALSTMPEGVALGLGAQDLVDLCAFLLEDPQAEPRLGPEVDLFANGLAGWTAHLVDPDATREDVWSFEDGVLVCKGSPIGYLRTEADYTNFVLSLEWRFDPEKGPGNSGVLLRLIGEDKVWPKSIEAQLHHQNAGDIWNIDQFGLETDPGRTSGRRTTRMQPSSERPLGEWNRYVITLDRGELRLEVNGVLQNRASWCDEAPGKIALQSEGAEVWIRNVRLRPIEH